MTKGIELDFLVRRMDIACLRDSLGDWLSDRRKELDFEWHLYRNIKV
jgi:hypothetical protein